MVLHMIKHKKQICKKKNYTILAQTGMDIGETQQ